MAKIFISYSSKDHTFAKKLAEHLHTLGHEPWLDAWKIKVGDCIPSKIQHGISEADYVVVVLSPDSVESGWVDEEWKTKYWDEIQEHETYVLPALLRDCEIPQLLKKRRHADFRDDYTIGFVELAGAIVPVIARPEEGEGIPRIRYQSEITELVAQLQAGTVPVPEAVARALPIALQAKRASLEWFCRNELAGWTQEEWEKYPGGEPTYRVVEAFASITARVNLQYWGWGRSAAAVFEYLRDNPDDFWPSYMPIAQSVSEIESKRSKATESAVLTFTKSLGDFLPDTETPDVPVVIYVNPDSYIRVLESIRTELTRRLLALLPKVST